MPNNHSSKHSLVPAVVAVLAASPAAAQDKVTYQDHVRPIFENRCLNCHNPDKKKGGLDLSTYGGAVAGGSGGVCVDAGEPKDSKLFQCITFAAEPFMPPKSDKIAQGEIDMIAKWIQGGLLETSASKAKAKKKQNFEMATGGNPLAKPEGPPPMPEHLLLDPVVASPKPNSITSVAHNPWSPLLAVAGVRQVLLYHSDSGDLLGVLPFPEGSPECVGFSRNGSIVFAGGGTAGKNGIVALWEVKTGRRVATLGEEFDSVLACDITPDHKRVALGGPGRKLKIYDTASGQAVATVKKHTDWILCMAFSPDGVLLASGDRNGGLYVWETGTGNEFYNLKGHEKAITGISWRPDSNVVASSSEDGTVRWWEMQNGGQIKSWAAHGGAGVLSVAYAADARLVTGGRDGKVRIFAPDGNQKREFVPANGSLVLRTGFTPDGKRVFSGSWSGELKLWDCEKEAKDAPPLAVIVNPPTLEARLAALQQELAQKQTAIQQAQAAASEKEKSVAAAKAESAAMLQQIAAAQAEQQKAAKAHADMKAAMAKLTESKNKYAQDLEAARKQVADLKAAPPAEPPPPAGASEAVKASLQQATQAQTAAREMAVTLAESKVTELGQAIARCDAEMAQTAQAMPPAEQQASAMSAKVAELNKAFEPKKLAIDAAEKGYADAMGLVQQSQNAVGQIQKGMNWWQAAKENKTVLTIRVETDTLREEIDGMKADIPAAEAEIAALNQQKSANPPPPPDQIAKIDQKLAAASKRLEETKKELPAAEAKLAERQKALDSAWQKYLSMLPK